MFIINVFQQSSVYLTKNKNVDLTVEKTFSLV